MKRTWKQIGSLFMAVCMVLTMMPMVAFAAEGDTFTYENLNYKVLTEDAGAKTGTVALVGGSEWYNLSVAEAVYNSDITYTVTQVGDGSGRIFPLASNMGDIIISDTVTTIADKAFWNAPMDSIILGNSLETIGKGAFQYIDVLKSIKIPDSVTTIDEGAFSYPIDLEQVTFGASSQLETIGKDAFKSCGLLTEISIPDSVTTLGDYAFSFCGGLTTLAIGNGIEYIGEGAFQACTNLAELTIPSSVKNIGAYAFKSCQSLTDISIPNSVTSIGMDAFNNCTELLSVDIPNSVVEIGAEAFAKCTKLNNVIIPESVDTIGEKLFNGCTGLEAVTVGNIIGELMFNGCSSLKSVTITGTPEKIEQNAFLDCTELSSIIIPDSVKIIDSSAFSRCSKLSGISWGNSVETIGSSAFSSSGFTYVAIPKTVKEIGGQAFQNCSKLTDVTIGSGVNTMRSQSFLNCANLRSATFLGDVPTTISNITFQGCTSLTSIYVPDDKVDAYKAKLTNNTDIIKPMSTAIYEITGFNALAAVDAGAAGSTTYASVTEVIAALPVNVTAKYSGGTVEWPVTTWVDTDGYNSYIAGSYTFTATLDAPPARYANSDGHTATVEVVVSDVLPDAPITTHAGLKAALMATAPATINVTADIDLLDNITLGTSHTLNIDSGKTVSTQGAGPTEGIIEIPAGMTLNLTGPGTLKSDNYMNSGIVVLGTLSLEPGSKLLAASSGMSTNGFDLGRDSTPGTLVSNGGHITLQNSGEFSAGIKGCSTVPSDVTLNGGTLTISNTGNTSFGVTDVKLTAKNDCAITVSSNGDIYTIGIDATITTLQDGSTLTIENTAGKGLYGSLSVDASTVTVKNSGDSGIAVGNGRSLNLKNNSILNLENTGGTGLILSDASEMMVDGSTVNVKDGGGMGFDCNMPYTTVTGLNSGRFILTENAKLSRVEGPFRDQGFKCINNSSITVGAAGVSPSADGLTAGEYVWKGTIFAKGDATTTYPISVTNGSADPTTAKPGDIVTLTADPAPAGQQFKEWICTSGNATIIYDGMTMSWKFTMPASAVEVKAVYEAIPYLQVLGIPVNDANKDSITGQGINGGVSYDPTTRTLTLNNAVITSSTSVDSAINTTDDLNVRLVGQNRIGTAPRNPANKADYSVEIGIFSGKSLSLTGEGSLTVYDAITGIHGVDNLTVDIGGSLTVVEYGDEGKACCLKTNGVLTIERGSLNLTSYNSKGLQGDSIVINGGVITAQTQGASGHYAFSTEPSFGGTYAHRVFAGENADSAVEVPSPVAATFNASKYVRIQPEDAQIYTISFNTNGGNTLTPGTLTTGADGKLPVLPVPTRSGSYRFDGWYTAASGGTRVTTSTAFSANTTIYAHWTYTGSGDNGGGSSSGGKRTTPTTKPAAPAPSTTGSTATTTVTTTTGADGKAAASVPAAQVDNALKQAQAAAAKSGEAPRIEIIVEAPADATAVEAKVPQTAMAAIASGKLQDLTMSSPVAGLTFDGAALNTLAGAAGDVSFSASRVDTANLPAAVQALIGNRPVYEFSVTCGGNTISQFGGNVTVAVPYRLGAGEDPNAVIISFINAGGKLEIVTNGRYDAATGTVVFTTDHFSRYAIGYNKLDFTDVANSAWYADAVTFLAARGITGGTTATTFSPDGTLTRGQFITLLMRAYGVAADENMANNFSDAGSTYYTGYLAAARHLGITSGVGSNKFAPEQAINRQEMFTMLYNALKVLGKLPAGDRGKTLADFTDSGSAADWATEALTALAKTGTVTGSGGKLDPMVGSTRAQMAQVLYNLLGKQQ